MPDLFPILRHGQFEDQLNYDFADPINGILRAIQPGESTCCRVEIEVRPAGHRRCHAAMKAVHRLDRPFFHQHHCMASFYARHITRQVTWSLAWIVGLFAVRSHGHVKANTLVRSTSRTHEREADLQAASDKLGGHLFEALFRFFDFEVTPGNSYAYRVRLKFTPAGKHEPPQVIATPWSHHWAWVAVEKPQAAKDR